MRTVICPTRRVPRNGGFTLIELLVVVAIVSILIAILLPSLRSAKAQARLMVCQANLRQIAMAWQMYLQDSRGFFYQRPNADMDYGGWVGAQHWQSRPLNPYLRLAKTLEGPEAAGVFTCPCDDVSVPNSNPPLPSIEQYGTSYRANLMLIGQAKLAPRPSHVKDLHKALNARLKGLKISAVAEPATLVLIGDYGWVDQWEPGCTFRTEVHGKPYCHNVAFLDTHTAFLKIRKGMYVIPGSYRVQPFEELDELAVACQREEPSP